MSKYNVRRKAQLGLDIREGGIAIPIAPNMYYMDGRSHDEGGIAIGPNNKNGLEVEGGEVVKVGDKDIKVFSSVPLLRGVSPAQLVMGGANPNKVFAAQEEFKNKNRINDDGTHYEVGGEKRIYTPTKSIQRQIQETGKIAIGGAPTIGGLRSYKYLRGLANVRKYANKGNSLFNKLDNFVNKGLQNLIDKHKISVNQGNAYKSVYNQIVGKEGINIPRTASLVLNDDSKEMKTGGIYIKPSKRGTFTAAATKHGMGVQEFASKVLANKENYSPAMVKKANFARNASRWKKEYGGSMIYTINGNVKNGLMSARLKAQYGKEKKINKDTKIGEDGLIYTKAIDGDWYTDGTRYEDSKYYMSRKSAQAYSREKFKRQPKPQSLDEVVVTGTRPKVKEDSKPITVSSNNENVITTQTIEGKQVDYPKTNTGYKSFTYKKDKDGKFIKVYDGDKRYNNSYIRPSREGVNYKTNKYNPLTGERVDEQGIIETSEPSIKGTTKVSVQSTSTPRKGETKSTTISRGTAKVESPKPGTATNPMEARYASRVQKGQAQEVTAKPVTTYDEASDKNPDKNRYTRATGFKNGDVPASPGNNQKEKDDEKTKDVRWIGQYKPVRTEDWIGLGSNLAGSVASYFMTKNTINKTPNPIKPVMAQAAKLKTKYNIEPQLTELREAEQMNRAAVRRNTQSSNTSLAREQRLMNEARGARNTLYGQKENIETQLINQDRLNRQSVVRDNIRAYNEYLNRVTATKMAQNEMRASNINNLISGLTGSVSNILGTIESRRATNNTLRAIAAANPNVDARLIGGFDYYIDPITKKKYNKNQQYVGTING